MHELVSIITTNNYNIQDFVIIAQSNIIKTCEPLSFTDLDELLALFLNESDKMIIIRELVKENKLIPLTTTNMITLLKIFNDNNHRLELLKLLSKHIYDYSSSRLNEFMSAFPENMIDKVKNVFSTSSNWLQTLVTCGTDKFNKFKDKVFKKPDTTLPTSVIVTANTINIDLNAPELDNKDVKIKLKSMTYTINKGGVYITD